MSQQYEKEEKRREQDEKQEEKQEEKGRGEKWRRDPVSAVVWSLILVWVGVVLLVESLGLLAPFGNIEAWRLIFIGAGVILFGEGAFRLLVPVHRRPVIGTFILGAVFLAVGLGNLASWTVVGPALLIAIGVLLLLRGLLGRR